MNNKPSEASSTIPAVISEMQAVAAGEYEGHDETLDPWTAENRATIDQWLHTLSITADTHAAEKALATPAPGRGELRERIARIIDPDAFDGLERERQWCRQNNKDETAWCSGYIKSTNAALAKSDKALNAILSELLIK